MADVQISGAAIRPSRRLGRGRDAGDGVWVARQRRASGFFLGCA